MIIKIKIYAIDFLMCIKPACNGKEKETYGLADKLKTRCKSPKFCSELLLN